MIQTSKPSKIKPWIIVILFLSMTSISTAQQFGGNPTSRKWMQMNTDSLRVLFPQGYKKQATVVFNTSLHMLRQERASLGYKSQKFNIILQPETVISNGFVALAPFRSVFMTTPPPDNFSLGTTDWLKELSIHETWHGLQNMNFKTGLGKTFHTLFGDMGQSLATHALIPGWYWEGDAVFMESHLTHQGRGRLPAFMAPYKALWLSDKKYPYAKIRNGSLKDIVPNQYVVGYMTVAYGRNKYGFNFWKPVLQEALLNRKVIKENNKRHPDSTFHLFKYGFFPLDAALKYHTGKNIKHFYYAAAQHFKQEWKNRIDSSHFTTVDTLKQNQQRKRRVLNYRYPTFSKDGNLLALKYGHAQLPEIISIDPEGKEKTLVPIGQTQQPYFTYGGDKITWAEYRPDSRWGWKSYSIIRLYDLKTQKTKRLSSKSSYFAPALSADGQRIITVEENQRGSHLVLLDAQDGTEIKTFPNPLHYVYTYPVFDPSQKNIIAGAKDSLDNMALVKIAVETGEQAALTPFVAKAFGPAGITKDYIYFTAGFGQEIQAYVLRRADKKIFRIARRPMGDYSLDVDEEQQRMVFDEYSLNGFQLLSSPLDTSRWQPVPDRFLQKVQNPFSPKALTYGQNPSILKTIPSAAPPPKPYHPLKHLFNVHSWSFVSAYPETGLALQFLDLLGTLEAAAGGGYNFNEETPFIETNFTYGGLFPLLRAGASKTFNRRGRAKDSIATQWDETKWYTGFNIPLNLSGSLYQRQLSFAGAIHQSILHFKKPKLERSKKSIAYYSLGFSFNNLRNRTIQGVNPKFGLGLSVQYNQTLKRESTSQFVSHFSLFLPGLFTNHSLYFRGAFSEKNNSKYKFVDNYNYAFGYHSVPYKEIYTLGANYQLPLFYPDFGMTWIYLLRVRLHAFYNYSQARLFPLSTNKKSLYRSTGLTLYFDFRLFNIDIPIGLRYSHLIDTDPNVPGKDYRMSVSFPIDLF